MSLKRSARFYVPRKAKYPRRDTVSLFRRHKALTPKHPGGIFPHQIRAKLRYCTSGTETIVAGSTPVSKFRANCIYNPQVALGGHQAMGFDELMGIYGRFLVVYSTITVQFNSAVSNESIGQGIVAGVASKDTDTSRNWEQYTEAGGTAQSYMAVGGGTNNVLSLKNNFSLRRDYRVKDPMDALSTYGGDRTSSPLSSNTHYFHIFASSLGAASSQNIHWKAVIEYTVIFSRPSNVAQS